MKWAIYGLRKERGSQHRQQSLFHLWGSYWNERDAENAKDEAYIAYMGPLFGLLSFYQRYRFI